jgi:organic hydroperoxide reductase OsmC/OhrA
MSGKSGKQFLFEVQLNWLADTRGILTARNATGTFHVATPPEFGGEGKPWAPEHLFLSAVCSSFMTTYLAFAKKLRIAISGLECNAIGQIEIVEGKYKFTHINLYPKIFIDDESVREKATLALDKTHKYCLVTNSLNAEVFYHSQVQTGRPVNKEVKISKVVKTKYTIDEAKVIGIRLGIDFTITSLQEFRRGLEVEMEHGRKFRETNITKDNEYMTGKIAWAHLHEIPDYYSRLDKMEKEAVNKFATVK